MKVYYLPLEAYRERYTECLTGWTCARFRGRPGIDLTVVNGVLMPGGGTIKSGAVLDAHGRSYWSTTQVAALVSELYKGECTSDDVIYLDDMFTPGYAALPYILSQTPRRERPRLFARNHAQCVDPDDFTFKMRRWMRSYEHMVYQSANSVICASSVHKEAMEVAMLDMCRAEIEVLGLPYDSAAVRQRGWLAPVVPASQRPHKVIYSSRFDAEKQPHFFMDIVESSDPSIEFVLCTGSDTVRSSLPSALERLAALEKSKRITVHRGCTKPDYYAHLASSRVQLNTARQDYVSYTALEASTFGTSTLAPAFRSFPEALRNNDQHLFVPWSISDAVAKLANLVAEPPPSGEDGWLARVHDLTLDRIIGAFAGELPSTPWWELV